MMKNIRRFAPTFLFCAFLLVMLVLFLVLPKRTYSAEEKRTLEPTPKFSFQSLTDGSFGKNVESYLSDHFSGRKFFVGLNAYYTLYTGRNGDSGIYQGNDGYLINTPVSPDENNLGRNLGAINAFAQATGLPTRLMVVPSTGYIMEDKLPAIHAQYHDADILASLSSQLNSSVEYLDLQSLFFQNNNQPLYYKTDHHWTSAGAYLAYTAYCQSAGLPALSESDFTKERFLDFYGTTYSRSGLWLNRPDDIELWQPPIPNVTVEIEEENKEPVVSNRLFFPSHLQEEDKYPVFLDGNHSLVRVTNPDAAGGRLLVVKDSFAHCFTPFLAAHYQEIVMVDLRYYKKPLTELVKEEGIDEVLVLYGLDNMVNDTNLIWLK